MRIDLDNLPVDTALLHRLVRDMAAVVESRDGEIERLQLIITSPIDHQEASTRAVWTPVRTP
jgi:hypothetical protein